MMMKNSFARLVLLALLLTLSAGCGSVPESSKKEPLRVEYTQWWGDYTLLVAQEKGFFEEYGVQVEPVYYEVFSDTYPDLAAGQIDGAMIAVGDTININHFTPMKAVAVQDNGGDDAIVVAPDINTIQDLKGKTIGVQTGSQFEITVIQMLQSANMKPDDVIMVMLNPEDTLTALASGRVQAASTWEPYLSEANANGYRTIYPSEQLHLFPDLIVFRKSIVEERPEDIRAFLKAWFKAVEYRVQNEEETREIAAKYLGVGREKVQPDDNLGLFTLNDNKMLFNIQEPNSIYSITKFTSDYLTSTGAITQVVDPLELLDPSYLP